MLIWKRNDPQKVVFESSNLSMPTKLNLEEFIMQFGDTYVGQPVYVLGHDAAPILGYIVKLYKTIDSQRFLHIDVGEDDLVEAHIDDVLPAKGIF